MHRQIGRLLDLENAIDITGSAAILIDRVCPIGEESAGEGERVVGRGQTVFGRESNDQGALLRPPLGARANSVMPRSIASALWTSMAVSSTPNDGAAVWMAAKPPEPAGTVGP